MLNATLELCRDSPHSQQYLYMRVVASCLEPLSTLAEVDPDVVDSVATFASDELARAAAGSPQTYFLSQGLLASGVASIQLGRLRVGVSAFRNALAYAGGLNTFDKRDFAEVALRGAGEAVCHDPGVRFELIGAVSTFVGSVFEAGSLHYGFVTQHFEDLVREVTRGERGVAAARWRWVLRDRKVMWDRRSDSDWIDPSWDLEPRA